MRAYFFQNFYLQGIHAGIQSQHTTAEMFIKYTDPSVQRDMLYEWATQYKTTVVLNGGVCKDLEGVLDLLRSLDFPFDYFKESYECLNNALTNVGVILPEHIYNAPRQDSEDWLQYLEDNMISRDQELLIRILQSKRLMT